MHLGKFIFVLDDIAQIALGTTHTCALNNDGEVKCWGRNNHGQLGNGTTDDSLFPVGVHTSGTDSAILDDIEQIALGDGFTCALTTVRTKLSAGEMESMEDWAMEKPPLAQRPSMFALVRKRVLRSLVQIWEASPKLLWEIPMLVPLPLARK